MILDKHPFISVIVPCRNEEKYINGCLDSLISQDYPKEKMEILVVDGASEDNTEEITIEALPLPLKTVGGYISAHDFLDDKNMLFIGMYNGLVSGNNRAMDPSPLMIPSVYINHYQDWFDFLLKTITYNWSFLTHPEKLQTLKVKSVIYAYQNYHLIERISRSNTTPELLYIEIETKTLI